MNTEFSFAEAVEAYYKLDLRNNRENLHDKHPSRVFAENLRTFLTEEGIELNYFLE